MPPLRAGNPDGATSASLGHVSRRPAGLQWSDELSSVASSFLLPSPGERRGTCGLIDSDIIHRCPRTDARPPRGHYRRRAVSGHYAAPRIPSCEGSWAHSRGWTRLSRRCAHSDSCTRGAPACQWSTGTPCETLGRHEASVLAPSSPRCSGPRCRYPTFARAGICCWRALRHAASCVPIPRSFARLRRRVVSVRALSACVMRIPCLCL